MGGLNEALEGVTHGVQAQPGLALAVLFTVNLLTLTLAIVGFARAGRLARRQAIMLRGVDGGSLERLLMDYSTSSTQIREQLERALTMGENNAEALRKTPRRVGMVRYNAFANVGGLQSFSFALLDEGANGIVLTGLYSRQEMRVYAKPVQQGRSSIPLTPEEQRAVANAALPHEFHVDDVEATEV